MSRNRQRGATLVVGLVMLVVLTLLVLSAIRSGNVNLRIAGNMQMEGEIATAAVEATERIISTNFTANPASQVIAVLVGPDLNGDGKPDYSASVPPPVCTASLPLTNADLNPSTEEYCISSATAQNTGFIVLGKLTPLRGQSWCYQQQWEVRAQVTDSRSGATSSSVQGVSLRVPAGTACP